MSDQANEIAAALRLCGCDPDNPNVALHYLTDPMFHAAIERVVMLTRTVEEMEDRADGAWEMLMGDDL